MTMNNEAFEKLALENEMDIESLNPDGSYANIETESAWLWFQDGLRIATTEANKRIAELKQDRNDLNYKCMERLHKIEELQAHRNTLLEAGQALIDRWDSPKWVDVQHTGCFIDALRRAIEATPAESLQAHDDELIKKCAKVCDKWIGLEAVADAILALKEVK